VAGVSLLQGYPVAETPAGGWRVTLGDLYGSSPLGLGIRLHVEDVALLGPAHLVDLVIRSDAVTEHGIEQRTVTLAVEANLDGRDHAEPVVEKTFLGYEAAKARGEAVRKADEGDLDGAAATLREASERLEPYASSDPAVAELRGDLAAEAERLEERRYHAEDRKYLMAMGVAESRGRSGYVGKVRRGRGR